MPQQMQTMQQMQQIHMQQMQMAHIMNHSDCDAEVMQGALELLGLRNHFSAMSMSAASPLGDSKKSKKGKKLSCLVLYKSFSPTFLPLISLTYPIP